MRLLVELFADGGIRAAPPTGRAGLASLPELERWVDHAAGTGYPVHVTGRVHERMAVVVVTAITERLSAANAESSLTVTVSEPEPWPHDWSTLLLAAEQGLEGAVRDLLERGASMASARRHETPYRLAMRSGHVAVMGALRAAGADDPVPAKPPGASPATVVMRMHLWAGMRWFVVVPPLLGLVVAVAIGNWLAALAGLLIGVINGVVGLLIEALIGRTNVAVDGSLLYVRRFYRWTGPVDLRHLVAVGYRPSAHRRTPILLRLVQTDVGEPFGKRTRSGFDDELAAELSKREGLRVVTVHLSMIFLTPGLARYVGTFVIGTPTLVSLEAEGAVGPAAR